uniref:Leucine-rich repeat-containing N-terminal plant-type domain-containing protein n=1 Tax=Opuntia streptacantha TaxID=393608 RepID=A0A7C9DU30_OPUST
MSLWWMLLVLASVKGDGIKVGEACLEEERQGLLTLKDAFNYPNGSSLPSWDAEEETDCCKWEKVTCEPVSRRVTQLHLHMTRDRHHFIRQSWTLNASLFLPFQDLQVLLLSSNNLRGLTVS